MLPTRPVITAAATLLLACSSAYGTRSRPPRPDPTTGTAPPTTQWLATLLPVPSTGGTPTTLRGAAAVKRVRDSNSVRALVSLAGAPAGTQVTWQVQTGQCGAEGQPLGGSPNLYPVLTILPDGTAAADVGIPTALSPSRSYSVTLRRYSTASTEPLACGNLALSNPLITPGS